MKQTLTVFSPAKVNLQLEIGECRTDGFHQAKSIMQALTLHDMVTVVLDDGVDAYLNPDGFSDFAIEVTCTTFEGIPELDVAPESNIAYKAAAALAEKLGHEQGHISIRIEKHIPFEAGLGGGSSNAAAVIAGLCRAWGEDAASEAALDVARALGADVAFFGHKLSGSIEFYNKFSYDVLANTTVPVISQGETSMLLNNAEILNRGIEFTIGSDLPVAGNLSWSGMLNYSYNHNELKKFGYTGPYMPVGPSYVVGHPIGSVGVLKAVGYTQEGYVLLEGKDGTRETIMDYNSSHVMDFVIPREGETFNDSNWAYYLGTLAPTSSLSFSNQFSWKGLTLSFMITGQFGYYVSTTSFDSFSPDSRNSAAYSKRLNRALEVYDEGYTNQTSYSELPLYTDSNVDAFRSGETYSATIGAAMYFKSSFVKGDHIRLNEVFLGYDLPENLLAKQGVFSRVNIYAQASNLGLIWSANGKMDPDYPIGSLKPIPVFTFGLRLGFKSW